MDGFLQAVDLILQTAQNSSERGEWTILTGTPDGVRMILNCDWPLENLQSHLGASAAYRVHHRGGEVVVEGCSDRQRIKIQSLPAAQIARFLLTR